MPAVVGEMTGGIALGPSLFGHYSPGAFAAIFPPNAEQFHLLDAFGSVGMSLLLLLTGLETDLRLLRNLGRAALIASVMGMVLPFALGFGLGYVTPAAYLTDPEPPDPVQSVPGHDHVDLRDAGDRQDPRSISTSPSATSASSFCRRGSSTTRSAG